MSNHDDAGAYTSFETYVLTRRAALLRTAYLLTGDHADAEDLVQVTLVRVVGRWPRIADRPDAYVRTVLVRENISRWRRRRWREHSVDQVVDRVDPGSPAADAVEDRELLRAALTALAPRQRAVVVLRYVEDLSEAETAAALGVSVGTVKSQARDALARLRAALPEARTVGS